MASTTSSSAAATRATSSRSISPTTSCTCRTSRSTWRTTRWRSTSSNAEPWRVTLVDTGDDTLTGGRLKRVARLSAGRGGVLLHLWRWRRRHRHHAPRSPSTARTASWRPSPPCSRRAATARSSSTGERVCAVSPRSRAATAAWINGGFFVLSPRCASTDIDGDETAWEAEPLDDARARRRADGLSRTTASGSRWTRCATRTISKICGHRAGAVEDVVMHVPIRLLARQARAGHRAHRLQGQLAGAVAAAAGRASDRVSRWPPTDALNLSTLRGSATSHRQSHAATSRDAAALARSVAALPARDRLSSGGAAAGARSLRAIRSGPIDATSWAR